MWTMKIFLQICYICTLFLIFLFGFDLPNFRKYLKDDSVLVLSKEILINPTQAPAITFCPTNPISGFGLKTIYGNKYKPNDLCSKIFGGTVTQIEILENVLWKKHMTLKKRFQIWHLQEVI